MHWLWNFLLEKRSFTILLMVSLTAGGIWSLITIPKESAPEVVIPVGNIITALPGASATDVERLITNKLEDEIENLENIDKVTSSSREGISIVSAQFLASANIDKSIQKLREAVDRAKLDFPREATQPQVLQVNFADQPILVVSISQDLSPRGLTDLGDYLKNEIKKIQGVSNVKVSGTRNRETQVIVRKKALEQYGINLTDVINAVAASNAAIPIGSITISDIDYPITFEGSIEDPGEVANIAIPTPAGIPLYLRDIAVIVDGLEKPSSFSRSSQHGAPSAQALTLSVYKKSGGDVTAIADAVKQRIHDLKETRLAGASVVISFDRGNLVKKDLSELTRVGLETVLLVLIVLFLTIGWRESLIAGISVPLSFLIAFIGLDFSGNTINFVSLFSLILAVGILVDSGIVVVEAIHTRYRKYGDVSKAARASIREYAWPLIAGTMTTVAVFVPLFFISGVTGKFIASIPFTVIFVLLASIFVALGMVPLLAVLFLKRTENRFEALQEAYTRRAQAWYRTILARILDSERAQKIFFRTMIGAFAVAILLPTPLLGIIKIIFFPQGDQDFIYLEIEKPQGTTLASTDLVTRKVEEILYEEPMIESFVTTVGENSSFNNGGSTAGTKFANITINLVPKDQRGGKTSSDIITELRERLADIRDADIRIRQSNSGPPIGDPVTIKFLGDDLTALAQVADRAESLLSTIPGTIDVQTSLRDDGTEFRLAIDRAKSAEVGLTPAQIAQTLRAAVNGTVASTIRKLGNDIDILVKLDLNPSFNYPEDTNRTTIDSVMRIPITSSRGTILLGSILESGIGETRSVITHENRKRVVSISSKLAPGGNAKEIQAAFKQRIAEIGIPPDITVDFGGENEEVDRSFRDMFFALVAGMALMLSILVLEFNSFRQSFYLLSIVPLSLIGVLGGLALTGQPLSFPSMLGVIALAGVIINHAIILLDSINRQLKGDTNRPVREIILDASVIRLRPIFLTTVTTVIGMIPLAFVNALWGPLAFSIMFGLSFAMLLTLVWIPILFWRYSQRHPAERHSPVE